eukprot:1275380-Rhodomonas_salina.1
MASSSAFRMPGYALLVFVAVLAQTEVRIFSFAAPIRVLTFSVRCGGLLLMLSSVFATSISVRVGWKPADLCLSSSCDPSQPLHFALIVWFLIRAAVYGKWTLILTTIVCSSAGFLPPRCCPARLQGW